MTLADLLPTDPEPDAIYDAFTGWVEGRGIELYPAQEEALIEIVTGANVILSTPTGSGKSLVATGAHFAALARDGVTFYTAPIKALVSEKFFALCDIFGAEDVGMLTGDASVNADAPIICCTAEVLANIALREGRHADVGQVVMDEFHFYAEPDRGWAWQVPLLELPQAQFVLMSATLGDVDAVPDRPDPPHRPAHRRRHLRRPPGAAVLPATSLTPLQETLEELLTTHQAPVYVVHFTQAAALERAQALTSINGRQPGGARPDRRGDRRLPVRPRLRQDAVPAGPSRHRRAPRRDAAQVPPAGRAAGPGRAAEGHLRHRHPRRRHQRADPHGGVHRADQVRRHAASASSRPASSTRSPGGPAGPATTPRAPSWCRRPTTSSRTSGRSPRPATTPRSGARSSARRPPEGAVTWSEQTFDKLVAAEPEALVSRMRVSHSMLLNVIARPGDPFAAMRSLLRDNHEQPGAQHRLVRQAIAMYRGLLAAGVVERLDPPDDTGRTVRLTVDLQPNFALNQPLSPFALAAFDVLDPESPTYALDVVSVLEATLDDPRQVLYAQQFKARGEAVAEMKAEGIEYDERMELLEDVTWPKPLQELLEATFEMYRQSHPWVDADALSPKSVVRDMYERAMTFGEFVAFYGLARSEGLVLRYLSDAYKALRQTVPDSAKTEELADLIEWLGEVVRQTDSSLLDEWEQLTDPGAEDGRAGPPGRHRQPAAADHRQRRGPSGCSCATRCSAGSSWPPGAAGSTWPSWTPRRAAWTRTPGRTAHRGLLRRARPPGHRPGRPRPADAADRGAARAGGGCARSSTTPPATTTGASPPRSTSPPRTRPARRSCGPPASSRSDPRTRPYPAHPAYPDPHFVPPSRRTEPGAGPVIADSRAQSGDGG